jgi:amidohydrolase
VKGTPKIPFFFLILLILLLLSARGFAIDRKTALLIEEEIQKNNPEVLKIHQYLHMNPELSHEEYQAARLVTSKLISLGLEVKTGVAKTGVVALLRGSQQGHTVGVSADMDASAIQEMTDVPFKSLNAGVMHACGHDIHASIALGTAMVLTALRDKIKGNIKFIFQPGGDAPPGEEGANLLIKEGVLEGPSVGAIFGLHAWPENLGKVFFSAGHIMANSDWFQITIKGKSFYGARPEEGIDSIAIAANIVLSLQSMVSRTIDPVDPAVLTIGKIEGGTNPNISAESVNLMGTVRALSEKNRQKIKQMIESVVKGITQSFGADYAFNYMNGIPAVYNHPQLAEIMLPTLLNLLGKANVQELKPQMETEDFSYYCQKIPGFFFLLGVKDPAQETTAPLHSPYFNPDERCIPLGIKIMCHLLLDCLERQSSQQENARPSFIN